LHRLLRGKIETYSMEKRYIKKDGSTVWANLTVSMARESSGESGYTIAVIQDITQRKRAEEALREVRQAERSRMARDLHDGVLQDLVDVLQSLRVAQMDAEESGSDGYLEREVEVLQRATRGMREAIYDLHPERSRRRSFVQDVESLVELERRMAPNRETDLIIEEGFPTGLSGATSRELFRIIQEALTNARRHSAARYVRVTLGIGKDEVWAEVSDDGKGFEPATTRGGMGLTAMQERAFLLGGDLEVLAGPGEGTRVRLRVPR
jgi:signal transduction histidine kinase